MPKKSEAPDKQTQTYYARPTTPLSYQAPADKSDQRTGDSYGPHREWIRFGVEFFAFIVLICYANSASIQADANQRAAKAAATAAYAAVRQAQIAQQTLEAGERPWIEVIATPTTPLTFDRTGGHITVSFQLKNYGKSPATYVFAETKFMSPSLNLDALDYQKECAHIRAIKNIPEGKEYGTAIFPGDVRVDTETLLLDEADIVASEKTISGITHFPTTTIEPQIIGCYIYRFRDRLYTTDFHYELFVPSPDQPNVSQQIKPEGTIPLSELKFYTSLLGNNAY